MASRFCASIVLSALAVGSVADVLVGRVDVTPSAGSKNEKPQARVVGLHEGTGFFATSNNRGDWGIAAGVTADTPKGDTLLLKAGVAIPSLNESVPAAQRGVVGVGGKLTTGTPGTLNGGFWVSGFTTEGNGAEANYDFALAYFPFSAGWLGGHVASDGMTVLAQGELPEGTEVRRFAGGTFDGEILLRMPGIDSIEDGLLFTTAAGNGDDTTAVGPLADGSGWHVRVADESHNYRSEQAVPFSFVFIPYACDGLIAGRVVRDGTVVRGVGEFDVRRMATGRYEVFIPGKTDKNGVLILEVTMMCKDGVEDNALAWTYSAEACSGRGGFVIESYDQPGFQDQDVEFAFAFVDYAGALSPNRKRLGTFRPSETWAGSVVNATKQAGGGPAEAGSIPWCGPAIGRGSPATAVSLRLDGQERLWLLTRRTGELPGAVAVWRDPVFILADGVRRPLGESPALYVRGGAPSVPGGAAPARTFQVKASSALLVPVPPQARRFEAHVGLLDGASEKGAVQFAITDRPHRRTFWREEAWPVLRKTFPVEAERLTVDLGQGHLLESLDMQAWTKSLQAGLAAMEVELGSLVERLPALTAVDGVSLLARHGEAARLLERVRSVRETVWRETPLLSRFMDYPEPVFRSLAEAVRRIVKTRPALTEQGQACLKALAGCERRCGEILASALDGKRPDPALAQGVGATAQRVAEWSSRTLGWTTYGGDNRRSWVCRESLTLLLRPIWTRKPAFRPCPAWPPPRNDNPAVKHQLSPTLTYDRAFQPAVVGGGIFFGSSSEDAVICLDASTGAEKWRFVAEGPVRLAPVVLGGRVYVGSDDGRVYCLDASVGEKLWEYRVDKGEDRRLCGNGRVISPWAVRCGICVEDGVLYAAAGVLPRLGAVLFALDAQAGTELWRRKIGWTPQGFMLLSSQRVFVPTGRTPFRSFSRRDGKPVSSFGRSNSWGRDLPGGTLALVVNERLITGPDEGGELHLYDAKSSDCMLRVRGRRVIVDGLSTYILRDTSVTAQERDPFVRRGRVVKQWETPISPAYCMLKVGDHLLVGGAGVVTILSAGDGSLAQRIPVGTSRVEGIVWNDGRLILSMEDGVLACLTTTTGDREPTVATLPSGELALPLGNAERAGKLAEWSGARKGYALVAEDVALGAALAQACNLRVVVAVADVDTAITWRKRLAAARLYGDSVVVHRASGKVLPYRPYMFNLVVLPHGPGSIAAGEWQRVVRPNGGLLVGNRLDIVADVTQGTTEPSLTDTGFAVAWRRGPLSGAGAWTHGYADAANTACSGDKMAFGAFEALWFGRPGPRNMLERHVKGAPPLYRDGTAFITGKNYLAAVDAYNGALLWEKHVKGSGRMAMLKDCGNMVATADGLHVAVDDSCIVFEGRTGRQLREHAVSRYHPEGGHWGYIAASADLLLGSATKPGAELMPGNKPDYNAVWYHFQPVVTSLGVFALKRVSGEPVWTYSPSTGVLLNPTITVLGNVVAFIESTNPATRDDSDGKIPLAELFKGGPRVTALRLDTGAVAWRVPIDLSGFQHAAYMSGSEGIFVLTGTRHDKVGAKTLIQYQLIGMSAADGRELWRNDNTPTRAHVLDGGHGEQTQHPAIVNGVVYGPGFARTLSTGEEHNGWKWQKSPQCATLSTSINCAFSRQSGNPTVASFATGKQDKLTRATRPGCWINTIPAGGVVLIPEASSGCTCGYSVQTSLALYPLGNGK
ncbi:MAG: PQQ-binding-like beta-propeller repeat protein [Lentisphaerae bacterium]|nr:PQQ-binding-like beta-propeller repeat protein [Lentisphaerota bacterium]MBT5604424.1 PQQ-binding-like beta-propeller repeat protein [Lentisphaerota bacterium]MBT7058181.1 PQQ-binding-like beta-propeller repeat protein [Lentisphaerota bacterium]MBT7847435.1 PQQ-binding-like beta-propeller repeat protein [Lentisphaerota bacterium]